MIVINFKYRKRIVETKQEYAERWERENPELAKNLQPLTFDEFLRKHISDGNLAADMFPSLMKDDEQEKKDYEEMLEEPGKEFEDHKKDMLPFEIAVVN